MTSSEAGTKSLTNEQMKRIRQIADIIEEGPIWNGQVRLQIANHLRAALTAEGRTGEGEKK